MKQTLPLIFLCLFSLFYQEEIAALPLSPRFYNYSVKDYNAGNQNWAADQDKEGRIYIGNNSGLLEFDGLNWQLYTLPHNTVIRSLLVNNDGRIYVGSYSEFGYFERNEFNRLVYTSLKDRVADYKFHNEEIWSVVEQGGSIYFQTFAGYFKYDGQQVTAKFGVGFLNFMPTNRKVYTQLLEKGFTLFEDGKLTELSDISQYNNDGIVGVASYNKELLILASRNSGLYLYDQSIKTVTTWKTDIDSKVKEYTINKMVATKDSCYIIGTISDGVYAIDKQGKQVWHINFENGLQNNTVQNLYCDVENNIWVMLDNGISHILHSSGIYLFEAHKHNISTPYDALIEDNDVYFASVQGLYKYNSHTNNLYLIGTKGQAWSIKRIDDMLISGNNFGTFLVKGDRVERMHSVRESINTQHVSIYGQEILLQNTYSDLNIFRKDKNGKWYFSNTIKNFEHLIQNIEVDHTGNIWAQHMHQGIYKIKLNEALDEALNVKFYDNLGDATGSKIYVHKLYGRVIFSDGNSFYTYDDIGDNVVPYKQLNNDLPFLVNTYRVVRNNKNQSWFINDTGYHLVENVGGKYEVLERVDMNMFDNPPKQGMGNVALDQDKIPYLFLDNTIAKFGQPRYTSDNLVRELRIKNVSSYSNANYNHTDLPIGEKGVVEYANNTINISLYYPVKGDSYYTVRYRLEGLDATDVWHTDLWSLHKEYTRLPYGEYSFVAEAVDYSGLISRVQYDFVVQKPFYLSGVMIALYIFLLLAIIAFSIYYISRRITKKKDKEIEEQRLSHRADIERKEKEIVEQQNTQLESELKFKSKELSNITMLGIRNKKFLELLKSELQKQNIKAATPKKFLDNMIQIIDENISPEDDWAVFQTNFDLIHEGFFRKLKSQYPDLTSNDLRLCALLRINMSTKDICNMLNISLRGIEGARYRLRKRLDIPSDQDLIDFMIRLK